ncbi:hypothetical protein D3C71_1532970 [compost metagenome]
MVHAGHVLFDDRAFVQIRGHIVRGGADDLDPARVRLVIRLRAFEAGQEAVVDVDRTPGQRFAQARRQNLHVTRQHHQVDLLALDQVDDLLLLHGAVVRVDRQVMERHPIGAGQGSEVLVIGGHRRDIHLQLPAVRAEQQVVEAMPLLAHQHQQARTTTGVMQLPVHPELGGQRGHARFHVAQRLLGGTVEMHAQEEPAALIVAELLGIEDVAAQLEQQAGHTVDDPGTVRA